MKVYEIIMTDSLKRALKLKFLEKLMLNVFFGVSNHLVSCHTC